VKGVARLIGHHQITSIAELRGGLIFRKKRNIRSRLVDTSSSSFSGTRSLFQSISFNEGKRKSVDDKKRTSRQTTEVKQLDVEAKLGIPRRGGLVKYID